jgi:xylulokinase
MAVTGDSALTSWVTDNRNLAHITYDARLVRTLGIDQAKLREIICSTDIVGNLAPAVAAELSLTTEVPVVAGSIDVSAAAVGSGAIADGQVHLYVGTSSWFGAHIPKKRTKLTSQIASVPCALPDRYLTIAMQSAAGANLSFLRDQVIMNQPEFLQQEEQPGVYRLLDEIASRVPAGARGILYTPWLFGERTPVDTRTSVRVCSTFPWDTLAMTLSERCWKASRSTRVGCLSRCSVF